MESENYDTLTVNELFSKLKSAEVDRGMTTKIEGLTDSHSLALIGARKESLMLTHSRGCSPCPL
jgi:hypothetical protein